MLDVYVDSIKEVIAKDGDLSWKYVIKDVGDESVLIEYYEISLDGKRNWEKKSDFRIDLFCAKQVFESGLKICSEI